MVYLFSKRMNFCFCSRRLTVVCCVFRHGSPLLHVDLHIFHVLLEICRWVARNYLSAASEVPSFWGNIT